MIQKPQEPLVACRYGWGRTVRLFQDHLEIHGTPYALTDLTYVQSVYRHWLGIASVRLILRFQQRPLILRGIADIAAAQRIVTSLAPASESPTLNVGGVYAGHAPIHLEALEEGFWEYGEAHTDAGSGDDPDAPTEHAPERDVQQQPDERRERLARLRTERSRREDGFDREQLAQQLQAAVLPAIEVPASLLVGEMAHYCTEATLCGEFCKPGNTTRQTLRYQPKDHGILILTNRRLLYLGRKRQIIFGYEQLLHVSRARTMVALLAEHWGQRQLFEMRRPLECTMYLERILQDFQTALLPMAHQPLPETPDPDAVTVLSAQQGALPTDETDEITLQAQKLELTPDSLPSEEPTEPEVMPEC